MIKHTLVIIIAIIIIISQIHAIYKLQRIKNVLVNGLNKYAIFARRGICYPKTYIDEKEVIR